jgi:hypothetical protein
MRECVCVCAWQTHSIRHIISTYAEKLEHHRSNKFPDFQVNAHLPSDDPERVRANLEEALKSGALEKQLAAIGLPLVPGSFKATVWALFPTHEADDQ